MAEVQLELKTADLPNMLPNQPYRRFGDKQNSDFFEEYLLRIYKWRDESGLTDNYGKVAAVVVEVDMGVARDYIAELSVMTMYKYVRSWQNGTYRWHLMRITPDTPDMLIRERLDDELDIVRCMTEFAPRAQEKPRTKYIGEIFEAQNLQEIVTKTAPFETRFANDPVQAEDDKFILWTAPSIYTWNRFGYMKAISRGQEREYPMRAEWHFEQADLDLFAEMKRMQKELEIDKYVLPYDHLATRVYSQDREHAILEFMRMSSYYYWGSFNIDAQNSSTNVTRPVRDYGFADVDHEDEYGQRIVLNPEAMSPAKVFTANNTPYYVNDFVGLPQPTENFVRNFGRRMHHLAVAVRDGRFEDGVPVHGNKYLLDPEHAGVPDENEYKFVDFVVDQLEKVEKEFLAKVIGSCEEGLKQIFSKSSKFSFLITEYIQRCNEYEGFFTKKNVAALTAAAGLDEAIKPVHVKTPSEADNECVVGA